MPAYLTLNRFVDSANYAFSHPEQNKSLVSNTDGIGVSLYDIPQSLSQEALQQNRRTWKIFRESLVETIGQRKFDWICQRYRTQLNFTRMENYGRPLLPEHIELFSIGSSQVLSRDIKDHFPGKLKSATRTELKERIRLIQPFPVVGKYQDPMQIYGAPSSMWAWFFHNKVLMDKEKQLLFSDAGRLSFRAWLERLGKVGANREFIEGQLLPAPGQDGSLDFYKVHRKITTGDGLVAYALRPATLDSTLQPLIVFRGSQWALSNEDCLETYMNDVQKNIGEMGWNAAKPLCDDLMKDRSFRRNEEKVSLVGYSLGGAFAQRFLEDHFDHVSQMVTHNSPSVDNATAERIRQKLNAVPLRAEPLNIQIFRTIGDFCHHVGDKHAGWGVNRPDVNIQLMEVDHDNKKISAIYLHAHRIFDNATFNYRTECVEDTQRLFKCLNNAERGPEVVWYENMRRIWGGVAFYGIYGLSKLINLLSKTLGVRVLRSSRVPDL